VKRSGQCGIARAGASAPAKFAAVKARHAREKVKLPDRHKAHGYRKPDYPDSTSTNDSEARS
jgi:hypothetical protein